MTYYVLEGIDCVGKSTQIGLLKKDEAFKEATFISEPDSSPLGSMVRKEIESKLDHKTMFLLFLASRAALFAKLRDSNPSLVISDRSLISGIAYSELPLKEALSLNLFATSDVLPSKVVFLKASKEVLEARLSGKKQDSIESKGLMFLLDVQARIEETLRLIESKGVAIKILDASQTQAALSASIKEFFKP
ncbi:dTMP kinase [Helicobacter sp. 11S02629-2]|uniref:dTMP kinase n=1 Tax=Helicobacter sp. 11S02629-2 TaxID=1476195 RepID=UPI000BA681FF|nr:dTMP kinase [Helicobacter sp. 11S02629-2]PAF45695.1 dTMP kinase [Helicobacter sp. 11S02629-2]